MNDVKLMYPNASLTKAAETLIDYVQQVKGFRDGLNAISYFLKWAKVYYGSISRESDVVLEGIDVAKTPFAIQKGFIVTRNFIDHCNRFQKEEGSKIDFAKEIFFYGLDMTGVFKEILKFAHSHDIFPVNPQAFSTLNVLGTCSLIIGPGQGVCGSCEKMYEISNKFSEKISESERIFLKAKIAKVFVSFAICTSYASMGMIMASNMLFKVKIAGWVTLALSTNAFAFGIFGYLHEKLSVLSKS